MKTKMIGGLMSSENMVQTLMNMMQNPCLKHAQNHPHVVSSMRPRKKRFSSKTFNNSHSPIVLLSPISVSIFDSAEEGGGFFYLARGITKPYDSAKAIFKAPARLASIVPIPLYIIQSSKFLANIVPKLVYITQRSQYARTVPIILYIILCLARGINKPTRLQEVCQTLFT